jgi:hypothetical protein
MMHTTINEEETMRAEKMTYFDSVIPNASVAIKIVCDQSRKFTGFASFSPGFSQEISFSGLPSNG